MMNYHVHYEFGLVGTEYYAAGLQSFETEPEALQFIAELRGSQRADEYCVKLIFGSIMQGFTNSDTEQA